MRILLDESSGDAGGTPSGPSTEPTTATPSSAPAAPAVAPAAATVAAAAVTEETELLRAELEKEKALRKQREQEVASITDEHQRYKDATEARAVPVKPGKVKTDPAPRRFLRR